MRDDLKADLVVDAHAMAVTRRQPAAGLIHQGVGAVDCVLAAVLEATAGRLCQLGWSGSSTGGRGGGGRADDVAGFVGDGATDGGELRVAELGQAHGLADVKRRPSPENAATKATRCS